MTHRYRSTVNIGVYVDVNDVLSGLSDDDLSAALQERRKGGDAPDVDLTEVLSCLYRSDTLEAITILERYLYPKYADAELARKHYADAIAHRRAALSGTQRQLDTEGGGSDSTADQPATGANIAPAAPDLDPGSPLSGKGE